MKILDEFKEFINRGNVMDMAVGVIVGSAFTAIVTSLTTDILNPLIKLITGGQGTEVAGLTIPVAGTENGIDFGAFISAIINFLIVAWVVFLIVKAFNKMRDASTAKVKALRGKDGAEEAEEDVPTVCPFCLEEINEGATRCPHCTAILDDSAKDAA
jgi:large conductance mechanosensitive channel